VFLFLAVYAGFIIVKACIPDILNIRQSAALFSDSDAPQPLFPQFFIAFPAAFSVGVVFSGWITYFFAYVFRETGRPMLFGTLAAFAVLIGLISWDTAAHGGLRGKLQEYRSGLSPELWRISVRNYRQTLVFFAFTAAFIIWMMTYTFFVSDGKLYSGYTVFSDFAVHTAIIRSFSMGGNFPTQFPHFPDGTIRYHFLFQFITGVLEYLGLRIELALNLLSILALLNCAVLLYVLAVRLTGRGWVGKLTVVFMFFRSSFSGIIHIIENGPYPNLNILFDLVLNTNEYIGRTANEDWGLWTANVYINQRHLALGISVLLLVVLVMLPHMEKMLNCLRVSSKGIMTEWLFSSDAWLGENYVRAVFLGILTGGLSFFNGATVIALLSVLAVCAIFSKHRLEFLIVAVLTWALTSMESAFFAPNVELVDPRFFFGFLASDKSMAGVLSYIIEVYGIAPFLALTATLLDLKKRAGVFLMTAAPCAITFCLSLTPDINVNHKYFMISMTLMNIFAADAIVCLYKKQSRETLPQWIRSLCDGLRKGLAGLLLLVLVSTGFFDNITIYNSNGKNRSVQSPLDAPFNTWILENTKPGEIFASAWHTIHPVFLTGRFEYMGWPYYAWSAGYDTDGRRDIMAAMFASDDPSEFLRRARENHISYILVDADLLSMPEFSVNEALIQAACPLVYSDETAGIRVYKTD
jgi:hypothetical protein